MGAPAELALPAHGAIAVPTGGALPDGADAVVMIEYTQEAMAGTIEVVRPVAPGEGIVRADEDLAPGQTAVRAGRAAASPGRRHAGRAWVSARSKCTSRPVVTILATGDELIAPDAGPLGTGTGARRAEQLRRRAGARGRRPAPAARRSSATTPARCTTPSATRSPHSDLVVICAGSSVGARDETAAAVAAVTGTEIWCHGLAIKPGKPTLLAASDGIPIIGLPGNPRSALVVFRLIGMPLVRRAGGWTAEHPAAVDAAAIVA